MVAYVLRELRRQKVRNEKKKQAGEVTVTVRELSDLFPGLSEGIIRSRLKDRCSCIPFKVNPHCCLIKQKLGFLHAEAGANVH